MASASFSRLGGSWGLEPWGNEPGGGSVSLGQGGSLGPGDRSHHEHHKRPSLPGKHPAGDRAAGRWKHNHPGQKVLSASEYLLPLMNHCIKPRAV